MTGLNRRAFLALAALFAPVARLRAIAQRGPAAVSADEFLRLSQRLTGRTRLDAEVSAIYLGALVAEPTNIPLLARLARDSQASALTPAHVALERTIVEWWYTGIYTRDGERRVATHTSALMWSAMSMPAPGTCAGSFGAWARAPQPIRLASLAHSRPE